MAFANDHLACGAWLEAQQRGLAVPRQLALMGFGDFPLSRQLGGGITSLRPPRYEIGRETAATMLALLDSAGEPPAARGGRQVAWSLVERASSGKAST